MDWLRWLMGGWSEPESNRIMDDSLRCPRERTVAGLAELLDENRIVLARGTPSSGKSVLAQLLFEHYSRKGERVVIIRQWPERYEHTWGLIHFLIQRANARGYTGYDDYTIGMANIVWIFDEAQMTYGHDELWVTFIKDQHGRGSGPKICAFSSYGSPGTGPDRSVSGSPLAHLGAQHRLPITPSTLMLSPSITLYYFRKEFGDVLSLICSDYRSPLLLEPDAAEYVFNLTSGHPGAVSSIMSMLRMVYRSAIKHQRIQSIQKIHIIETLDREQDFFAFLDHMPVARSFVTKAASSDAVAVLREVLLNQNVLRDLNRPGVKECYQNGWLHAETRDMWNDNIVLVFPTRLHAKYVEHYFTGATLRGFSMRQLSSNSVVLGTSARVRPVEAVYQDEFYRALHEVLGFSAKISSEWTEGNSGRIDFWLPEKKWGIEILREGDRLGEHCERFVGDGTYTRWINEGLLVDWLIIDCRTTRPRKYEVPNTKLWRAVFSERFSSVEVLDASNQPMTRFALMP